MKIKPLNLCFGAMVTEVQLPHISDEEFTVLQRAWLDYALLIFPGQFLDKAAQIQFAKGLM